MKKETIAALENRLDIMKKQYDAECNSFKSECDCFVGTALYEKNSIGSLVNMWQTKSKIDELYYIIELINIFEN